MISLVHSLAFYLLWATRERSENPPPKREIERQSPQEKLLKKFMQLKGHHYSSLMSNPNLNSKYRNSNIMIPENIQQWWQSWPKYVKTPYESHRPISTNWSAHFKVIEHKWHIEFISLYHQYLVSKHSNLNWITYKQIHSKVKYSHGIIFIYIQNWVSRTSAMLHGISNKNSSIT